MLGKDVYRYSESFRLHVVSEIESGHMRLMEARRRYGITGNGTVERWLDLYGKRGIRGRVIRVERPGERDRVKSLESQVRELESALAQSQLKVLTLESLVEVAEEHYRADFKKNFGPKLLNASSNSRSKGKASK